MDLREYAEARPPATPAVAIDLIVRLARENPVWGYGKLQSELLKVGHCVSRATIKRVLRRQALPSAPRRGHTIWRAFLVQYRGQLLASDCFTVDTLFLQRLYLLFRVDLGPFGAARWLHRLSPRRWSGCAARCARACSRQ